jgi:hypothetical protein
LRHIVKEIPQECVQVSEGVRLFPAPIMPVVAFAALVVIAYDRDPIPAIVEPVLVSVAATK